MNQSPYRDPVAAGTYRRIAMPAQFAAPARDLVTVIGVTAGETVLDVGTGTGAFLTPALAATGRSGTVVGVDPSVEMMSEMPRSSIDPRPRRLVVGQMPGLPFGDDAFDAVAASFVLPHCRDHPGALADMARVCRTGGRVGITAWGAKPNPPGQLWTEIAAAFADQERTRHAFHGVLPRQEWFALVDNVERALDGAGLADIHIETRDYPVEMAPTDYLAMKEAGTDGAVIRQMVDRLAWDDFRRRVREAFRERFADPLRFARDVHFGVGTKR
jgi:ubiquinone/menaquinone biosynthesis C-methylase UbiE